MKNRIHYENTQYNCSIKAMIKLLFLSLFFISPTVKAQLSVGDIAFIGLNTDATEGYTFITLNPIPGSEEIFFTDRGIINSGSWIPGSEGTYKFTAPPAGLTCGTVVSFAETSPDVYTISGAPGATMTLIVGSANLGSGDQIIAYQTADGTIATTPSDATFIAAIHCDYDAVCVDPTTKWTQEACVSSTSESVVPPGLTNTVNCVSMTPTGPEQDNFKYIGTLTGTATFLRAEINDFTNWDKNNGPAFDISAGAFSPSVTCPPPCSMPTTPTISSSPAIICVGEIATLTITGTLNDGTAWHIYTGSCGGTEIGTTAGTTFNVTPEGSTTYFIRGEGGCVTPGSCGSIIVSNTATDDAGFTYAQTTYCPNGVDPSPTIVTAGGVFTSDPAGLVIDASSGVIDLDASTTGTYTITYTTSGACPSSETFSLTIEDDEAPIADLAILPTITAECEITALTTPTATDNCTVEVIITNDADLPMTEQGSFIINWTYDDGNGNTTSQEQTIIIDDITAPVPDVAVLDELTDECEITALTEPTATDNCGGVITVSNDAVLPINTQGTTVVIWTYTDVNGNSSTQTQTIIINDITAPESGELLEITEFCEVIEIALPDAIDNCGSVTITNDATFPITESTVVVWTYDDGNGNTTEQEQIITILPIDISTTISGSITITSNYADADSYQWIDCADLSVIDGATDPTFTPDVNGSYAVIISKESCVDTSACVEISEVGITENNTNRIRIYPNPVSSNFFFIQSNIEIENMWLVDMSGKRVNTNYNKTNGQVQIFNVQTGNYIVTIQTVNGKLIKKRILILE